MTNRQWLLRSRPEGEPSDSDFEWVERPLPEPREGQLLIRSLWLSVDPYMRGRMSEARSYARPTSVGEVMPGGVVGEVVESRHPDWRTGEIVEAYLGWQAFGTIEARHARRIDPTLAPVSTALGVLGMPGLTAYFGLLEVGQPHPGETVVVSAAAGAVGALVGQIARIRGCRAVGIAGGAEKCRYLTEELGFDAAIDRRSGADLGSALKESCPDGIHVYFDNVGGRTLDTVLRRIAIGARIAICGAISEYNLPRPELAPRPNMTLLINRARMQGLLVGDFADRFPEGLAQMAAWLQQGRIRYREDVVDGLENAPAAFLRLFRGENFGKQLVRIAEPGG